ncbi:MAG: hypothetical protein O3B01_32400 [Planctomycetota bacterium]|nr:hypothetical protein [Planctomycetota bacterium]
MKPAKAYLRISVYTDRIDAEIICSTGIVIGATLSCLETAGLTPSQAAIEIATSVLAACPVELAPEISERGIILGVANTDIATVGRALAEALQLPIAEALIE